MNFRLLIDFDVIEFMEALPRKEQRLLRNHFVEIQSFPSRYSDYVEHDSEGHRVDIHIYGKFAIKFWNDHADRHLKILDVYFADRINL